MNRTNIRVQSIDLFALGLDLIAVLRGVVSIRYLQQFRRDVPVLAFHWSPGRFWFCLLISNNYFRARVYSLKLLYGELERVKKHGAAVLFEFLTKVFSQFWIYFESCQSVLNFLQKLSVVFEFFWNISVIFEFLNISFQSFLKLWAKLVHFWYLSLL